VPRAIKPGLRLDSRRLKDHPRGASRSDQHCRLLAQMRSADCIEQRPLFGAMRKSFAHTEFFSV
jgi:hypothetical protein